MIPWSFRLGGGLATLHHKLVCYRETETSIPDACGSGWDRSSFEDNNKAVGSNSTGHPKADELARDEVKDKDWLLECGDSILGWQTLTVDIRSQRTGNWKRSTLQVLERVNYIQEKS